MPTKSIICTLCVQLGDSHEVLSLLVRTVHNHMSRRGVWHVPGAVVPPRVAAHLAERAGWPGRVGASTPIPTPTPSDTRCRLTDRWPRDETSLTPPADHSPPTPRTHALPLLHNQPQISHNFLPLLEPPLRILIYRARLQPRPQQRNRHDHNQQHHQRPPKKAAAHLLASHATSFDPQTVQWFHRDGRSARSRYNSFAPCALLHTPAMNARSSKHLPPGRISL